MIQTTITTPIGPLTLTADDHGLLAISWRAADTGSLTAKPSTSTERAAQVLELAARELTLYFRGELTAFSVPLAAPGTVFQQRVWQALAEIPYGTTVSYGDVARVIGQPSASRAVGAAAGKNPIPIIVPCHRVIGKNGQLTGFAGGLPRKRQLLALEGIET